MFLKDLPVGSYFLFRSQSVLELWYKPDDRIENDKLFVLYLWGDNQDTHQIIGHSYYIHTHLEVEGPIEMDFYIKDKFVGRT